MAMNPSPFLVRQSEPYGSGYNTITRIGEATADTGIEFGVLRLAAGERYRPAAEREGALLLMHGELVFSWPGQQSRVRRSSLFDQDPYALHFPRGVEVSIEAATECELAVLAVESDGAFAVKLFDGESMLESEHRGQGLLDDTAYRIVRTVFDGRNRPEARLVLGEVINFPGRWSSYPPHHHPQPEIYHYRFTEPQGYGHAELGDEIVKIQHGDTLKILDQRDHAQVAAPGYGMYYLWAIRHLPGQPYTVPEFTEEHRWLLTPADRVWQPKGLSS
jgi:5-deoxy-glucuronate isomerase